ncbi:MAG: cyclic nucleotide-binding domain-containing protein [Myxococcales bacterium]|nr:cyclic nucleotide-binding domain-containing protein [Myxococcales bacterium]
MVQRDARDAIVGYFAAHAFHRPVHGEDAVVLRGEAGFLRSHRGHNSTAGFGLREALKTVLREAGGPVYYLGCLVHPVSYYALAKRMRPVWPSPAAPVEGRLLDELCALGDAFGLEPVGDDPLVRHVGWRTLESPAERDWWARCDKPAVRYYVQRNPGYGAGHGLLTLARVSPATLAGAAVSVAREQGARSVDRVRSALRRAPGAGRWLGPAEVRRSLRALPLFAGLDAAHLARLAGRAELIERPAQRDIVRQGEAGDALYVVAAGTVQVLREGAPVEQMDAGEVFGEIGALTGAPRNATVRTVSRTRLIRVPRAAVLEALESDEALRAAVWQRVAARRFATCVRGVPRYADLAPAERRALFDEATVAPLTAGVAVAWDAPTELFVVEGAVRIGAAEDERVVEAPAWLPWSEPTSVRAERDAWLAWLPAEGAAPSPDPLLDRLPEVVVDLLRADAIRQTLAPGEILFAQGDPADAFYLVEAGALRVIADGAELATLGPGAGFGERGLDPAGDGRRTAGIVAAAPTTLLRVDAAAFLRDAGPFVFGAPDRPTDLLPGLVGAAWSSAPIAQAERRVFEAGAVVLAEGDASDAVYYVVEGTARVEQGGVVVAHLTPGATFGERGALFDTPRTATVTAATRLATRRVPAAAFGAWARAHPQVGTLLATLAAAHRAPGDGPTTTVHRGTRGGRPSVVAITPISEGARFVATFVDGAPRPVAVFEREDGATGVLQRVDFERAEPGDARWLEHAGGALKRVALEGDLAAAPTLAARVRRGRRLTRGEIERFRWTGVLGPPARGGARVVCGCVGVLARDLDALPAGCSAAEVACATGAGTVCGGCRPLVERWVAGVEVPAALPDEVTPDAFEARLDALRQADTRHSLFAPDSVMWRVFGENVALLGGPRGLLMQFAHPAVAQGLVHHAGFLTAPGDRFHATLQTMYGLAFGDGATMMRLAREVFAKHVAVRGRLRGGGVAFAANQVPLLLWVAATIVETTVLAFERLVEPLAPGDKDRLVAEAAFLFGLFGIPEDRFPRDWAALAAYVQATLDGGALRVGDDALRLANAILRPDKAPSEIVFKVVRPLTARWLPPSLAAAYGLQPKAAGRAAAAATEVALRAAVPRLAEGVRYSAARRAAERRRRGQPPVPDEGATLERLLAVALGASGRGSVSP